MTDYEKYIEIETNDKNDEMISYIKTIYKEKVGDTKDDNVKNDNK